MSLTRQQKDKDQGLNFDIYCPIRAVHTGPPGCRYADCQLPSGTVKNRPSAIDFGRRQSIEGEKGKKKRKRIKRKEEENLAPVLSRAASSPSPVVRPSSSPAPITARTRARRWNISPRGEKDRSD
ncbi:hypothetical protein B296_00057645, partial [Ensete ventricosum]